MKSRTGYSAAVYFCTFLSNFDISGSLSVLLYPISFPCSRSIPYILSHSTVPFPIPLYTILLCALIPYSTLPHSIIIFYSFLFYSHLSYSIPCFAMLSPPCFAVPAQCIVCQTLQNTLAFTHERIEEVDIMQTCVMRGSFLIQSGAHTCF